MAPFPKLCKALEYLVDQWGPVEGRTRLMKLIYLADLEWARAAGGNPRAFALPRSFLHEERLDFSFSGLKTAVLYALHGQNVARGQAPPPGALRADLAASFQQAVVDVLTAKARQALRRTGLSRLAVGGGVAANQTLRAALEAMTAAEGAELFIPPSALCTDNAAMAAVAVEKWRRGQLAPPDLDAEPVYLGQRS